MKRVLIIAYYFPPMGGSGVQRPLGLAKYLPQFGWDPVVLAPEPAAYHTFDDSLLKEASDERMKIIRVKNRTIFQLLPGKRKQIKYSEKPGEILRKITEWFFFPDNKKGWIEPASEKAVEYYQKNKFDLVFSTGPPFSNHLVAKKIKKQTGVPVIMDFRDDWLDNHLVNYPTHWHYNKMAEIEANTVKDSDAITVVNNAYERALVNRYPEMRRAIVLPNGFDPQKIPLGGFAPRKPDEKFRITFNGLFYWKIQPDNFLKAVTISLKRNPDLKDHLEITFTGSDRKRYSALIKSLGIDNLVSFADYKEHSDSIGYLKESDLLLLISADNEKMENVTHGKMFEYFGTRRPIFALVPKGVAGNLLSRYKAAFIAHPNDTSMISHKLLKVYELWLKNKLPKGDEIFSRSFSRKEQAKKLAAIMNSLNK